MVELGRKAPKWWALFWAAALAACEAPSTSRLPADLPDGDSDAGGAHPDIGGDFKACEPLELAGPTGEFHEIENLEELYFIFPPHNLDFEPHKGWRLVLEPVTFGCLTQTAVLIISRYDYERTHLANTFFRNQLFLHVCNQCTEEQSIASYYTYGFSTDQEVSRGEELNAQGFAESLTGRERELYGWSDRLYLWGGLALPPRLVDRQGVTLPDNCHDLAHSWDNVRNYFSSPVMAISESRYVDGPPGVAEVRLQPGEWVTIGQVFSDVEGRIFGEWNGFYSNAEDSYWTHPIDLETLSLELPFIDLREWEGARAPIMMAFEQACFDAGFESTFSPLSAAAELDHDGLTGIRFLPVPAPLPPELLEAIVDGIRERREMRE